MRLGDNRFGASGMLASNGLLAPGDAHKRSGRARYDFTPRALLRVARLVDLQPSVRMSPTRNRRTEAKTCGS